MAIHRGPGSSLVARRANRPQLAEFLWRRRRRGSSRLVASIASLVPPTLF
jgi:hypothetical protein